jgi:hypothetical protein
MNKNTGVKKMKKTTLTTIKKFIKDNDGKLFIKNLTEFDGIDDSIRNCQNSTFNKAEKKEYQGYGKDHTLGIKGAWFVFGSRDYFENYNDNNFEGFRIINCTGSFILARESA